MPRTQYLNGDPISLRCGCDGCNPARINGVLCHETGCPEAWRDYVRQCFECGCDFFPTERWSRLCADCLTQGKEC